MPRKRSTTKQTTKNGSDTSDLGGNYFSGEYTVASHEKPKRTTIEDYAEEDRQYYIEIGGKPYHKSNLPPHWQQYANGIDVKGGVSIQSFRETPSDKGSDD